MTNKRKKNNVAISKRASPRKRSSTKTGKKSVGKKSPVVIGIGASAGGLEAISQLLASLPEKPGIAIVFVQHLSPTHESALVELLRRKTTLTIHEVKHGMRMEPNHVYVIQPGITIELKKGACIVTKVRKHDGVFHPVDVLFSSIAREYGSHSIGVVLSGTATDGTKGLLAIKEAGGITFAQDTSAKHSGMPQSAVDAGAVDFILSPQGIAKELLLIAKHPHTVSIQNAPLASESGVRKILSFIQNKFDIDFTNYKRPMIERRIARRMMLGRVKTLPDYARYLEDTKGEDEALYQDLLINVTSFFRDAELFASLSRTVLPAILQERESKDGLRIWVPGCSTGQEVYSIAIILSEVLEKMQVKPQFTIKIFGTDASEHAIEKARVGIYQKAELDRLSHARLSHFFQSVNGSYQVRKSLREMCVFSPHNFLKDPPFSRMDLISCQNVLIYLDTTLQKKVIRTFHYALKPTGYLVLGKSETVGAEGGIFVATEKKHKIYTRKPGMPVGQIASQPGSQASLRVKKTEGEGGEASIENEADEVLLAHFTPASMVINAAMEIVRFRGATSSYLEPHGSASLNLLKMVREELVLELRSLLHVAKKEDRRTKKEGIPMKRSGAVHLTTIEVVPLKHGARGTYFMVLFSETTTAETSGEVGQQTARKSDAKERRIAGLLQELALHKVQMKSMGEEYEAANEELQSANEEVLSSNEELQSINEELETSQEELQSTNEELTTTNDELAARSREVAVSRDYNEAIIATIREPLIVLNHNLKVRTANQGFYSQFETTPAETEGRLLYELGNGQWDIPELRKLLNEILPKSKVVQDFEIEHEFPHIGRKHMLLNARTVAERDGKESLILLVVQDVTERKKREIEQVANRKRLEEAGRSKDEFLSMASHELRTPVTSIKGYAQILESRFTEANDAASAELVSKLDGQVDNLTALIADLFDDTKVKEGKLELHQDYFDFNKLVDETIDEVQYTAQQHTITRTLAKMPDIYGDRARIKQAIVNLLTNAIKYSPGATSIKVVTKTSGRSTLLSVQDFGVGISKKDQSKIFARFYRVRGKELDTYPGLGLGLYIAAKMVERHGGRMEVKSIQGKGSVFSIALPIKTIKNK